MAGDPIAIDASGGVPAYAANEFRQGLALAFMYGGRRLGARQGVRPGGNQLKVSLAGSNITVNSGVGLIDPGLTTPQGPYWCPLPADEPHTLTAADGTNPRKDIVVYRVYDNAEDGSGLRTCRSEYIVGTPAPSPSEPAVPAGSFKLAVIDVPQSGGGSPVVTDTRPFVAAPGGILQVTGAAEQAALSGYNSQFIYRTDLDQILGHNGTTFEVYADRDVFADWATYTPAITATTTNPTMGTSERLGQYLVTGKKVEFHFAITLASGFAVGSGSYKIDLPPSLPIGTNFGLFAAFGHYYDSSVSAYYRLLMRAAPAATKIDLYADIGSASGFSSLVSNSLPVVPAIGDIYSGQGWYLTT